MKQHLLQLYDDAGLMIHEVVSFLRHGADNGESMVVIATPEHRDALEEGLEGSQGPLVLRDARTLLDSIMQGDRVEPSLFERNVGELFETAAASGTGHVRGFGEMVALLWQEGNQNAAVRLERLWNGLTGSDRYALICAYPMAAVGPHMDGPSFMAICDGHSHVFASQHRPGEHPTSRLARLEREATGLRAELSRRLDVQHELSQRDESKDDFIAVLSHELRNPVTPIMTAVEMLKQPVGAEQRRRLVATIGRQTAVLARLIDDLLEARRVTTGRITVSTEDLRLRDVVEQAAESSSPQMEARGQHFLLELPDMDLVVQGDAVRLTQAITNLLNNASKFTPEGGTVSLKVTKRPPHAHIEVRDTGRGMDADFLQRAFEPYAQATVGEGGLGLGLAVVRSIVRLHHGTVEADSAGPGTGTTFTIKLPLQEKGLVAPLPRVLGRGASRVLVVDDNRDVRETLAALLEAYGHEVRTAGSGAEALDRLDGRPHVVLLDLGMPGMDGFEVARRIQQHPRRPLLIALSGHAAAAEAKAAGFDHQFTKPPDLDRLLRVIGAAPRAQRA